MQASSSGVPHHHYEEQEEGEGGGLQDSQGKVEIELELLIWDMIALLSVPMEVSAGEDKQGQVSMEMDAVYVSSACVVLCGQSASTVECIWAASLPLAFDQWASTSLKLKLSAARDAR